MNKWTRKWIPSLLAAVVLASTPVSVLSSTAYAETVAQTTQTKTYEQTRNDVKSAIEKISKEFTPETIKAAIDSYLQLPTLEDYPSVDFVDDKKEFAISINKEIDKIADSTTKDDVRSYFATKIVEVVEKSLSFNDFAVANNLVTLLPEGTLRTELATRLETTKKNFPKGPDGYVDWNNPPANLNDYLYPLPDKNYDNLPPGFDKDGYLNGIGGGSKDSTYPEEKYDRTSVEYLNENGKCVASTSYYKGNSLIKTDKKSASQAEQVFCGSSEKANTPPTYPTSGVFNGYDPYSKEAVDAVKEEENKDKVILEPITIQFTFEKSSESPYFYDLGITIGEARVLTYVQAKDALHMIAIRAKGKFVEDKGQALALIDGTIILIEDNNKQMAFNDFAKLFSKTNVEVRALDTRKGEHVELADLVEIKAMDAVTIGNKNIKLDAKPIVDNSIVLFPLEQIAKELGGTIEKTSDSVTVKANKHTLVYTNGKSSVLLDGKEQIIQVPVRKNKDDVWMAPIRALVNASDHTLEVENSTVIIK